MTSGPIPLDPKTVEDVLGPTPDPNLLACIRFDVIEGVLAIEHAIRTGQRLPTIRVEGRDLADWLPLSECARLIDLFRTTPPPRCVRCDQPVRGQYAPSLDRRDRVPKHLVCPG